MADMKEENLGFEKKTLSNGKPNPKYVDLLDEDPKMAGQHWGVFSFLTPGNILKKRENFLFSSFVKQWDWIKSMKKFMDFLHFVAYKYNLNVENLMKDFEEFLKDESDKIKEASSLEDDFSDFLDKNEEKLTDEFQRDNAFQTSVLGLKARGNFPTYEEASEHAKRTRNRDPNHTTFVGPVGIWIAWDPNPYKTQQIEFMEEQLNQLHKEKMKNEELAKQEFDKRIRETKEKAIRENIEKAMKSGNKLTQSITETGELIGVKETVDFDSREVADPDKNEELMKILKDDADKKKN